MISAIISRIVILLFGTLYPAYASYKAVRTKNVREYVKWMMYWIVFALFTCGETFTDVFLSWFPFYYEIKIVLVIWLLSPATKGSSILYRKFVHPALIKREQEIDEYISKAKEQGYHTVLNLGTKGVNYATNVLMQTAIKGGGGLVQQLRKSYSLSDLSGQDESKMNRSDLDEADDVVTDPRIVRRSIAARRYSPRRTASESSTRSGMYFPEVDLDVNRNTRSTDIRDAINLNHIRSSEDISSGYSSADNSATRDLGLMRSTSVSGSTRSRTRQVTTINRVTTIKRPPAAEGSDVVIEEIQESDALQPYFSSNPRILDLPPSCHLSETDPPFIFQIVNNRMKIIEILDYPAEVDIEERLQSSSDSEFLDTNDNDNKLSSDDTNALPTVDSIITTSDLDSLIVPSIVSNDHVIVVDDAHAGAEASIIAPSASASSVDYDSTAADESDVQFTTPGNSPKLQKKKIARKGRYGKQKAPSPPAKTAEQEQTAKITKPKRTKRSSPISKLMQIPGKLAFWHKSSDNLKVPVDSSTSSSSSRRSSIYEDSFEKRNSPPDGSANSEFGSAVDLKLDNIPLSVVEKEEDISKETTEIMEKGLALLGKLTELRESTKELNKLVTDV